MRKTVLALAAVAAFGLALPLTAPAQAQDATVVIKKRDGDRDLSRERRGVTIIKRDRPRYYSERRANRVVIINKRRAEPRAEVVIKRKSFEPSEKKVIIRRD